MIPVRDKYLGYLLEILLLPQSTYLAQDEIYDDSF